MPLTEQEKAENKRQRMLDTAKQYRPTKYKNLYVAPDFQSMIRAEVGADPRQYLTAVVDGKIQQVKREIGQCVCVTCGNVGPWKGKFLGGGTIESGHFIAGRFNSIIFEENNVHPQCKHCNQHLSGNQACYEMWMQFMYGQEEIDRLRQLKTESVSFSLEELVDMRIGYMARLKAAEERMSSG